MKKVNKICLMLAVAVLSGAACTKSQYADVQGEGVKVRLGIDMNEAIAGGTGHEPMARAENRHWGMMTNKFHVVIMKQVDNGNWYIADTMQVSFVLPEGANPRLGSFLVDEVPRNEFETELLPGTYRMLVVLNARTVDWNPDIKKGMLVDDGSSAIPYAFRYSGLRQQSGYIDSYSLPFEVFIGTKDFTISKDNTLEQSKDPLVVDVPVKRVVSRIRPLLQVNHPGEDLYAQGMWLYARWDLNTVNPGDAFVDGFDLMARPWYDKSQKLTSIRMVAAQSMNYHTGDDGNQYKVATHVSSRHSDLYILTDPAKDGMDVTMTQFYTTGNSGTAAAWYFPYAAPLTLYANSYIGFCLGSEIKPGRIPIPFDNLDAFELYQITDAGASTYAFGPYMEYDLVTGAN